MRRLGVPVLIERAGYVKAAKEYIHSCGMYYYIQDGRMYLETKELDYDITDWNVQSLRVLLSGAMSPT